MEFFPESSAAVELWIDLLNRFIYEPPASPQ
jgi:hypothetical protein